MLKKGALFGIFLITAFIFCCPVSANNETISGDNIDSTNSFGSTNSSDIEVIATIPKFSRDVNFVGESILIGTYNVNRDPGDRFYIGGGLPGTGDQLFLFDDAVKITGPNGTLYHDFLGYTLPGEVQEPGGGLYWHKPMEFTDCLNMGANTITLSVEDIYGYGISFSNLVLYKIKKRKADLSVSVDYTNLKLVGGKYTVNSDNVYGTDKIMVNVTVKNMGPADATNVFVNFKFPKKFKFINANSVRYNSTSGIWNIGDIKNGEKRELLITGKAINSGTSTIFATVNCVEDGILANNKAQKVINIHNPVVLVHGFNSNPHCWDAMIKQFQMKGITYFSFDYGKYSREDPYQISKAMFRPFMNKLMKEYSGKFDIVCHSMGALVSRFWMEGINGQSGNSNKVERWIGIGPVNKGAAVTDIWNNKVKLKSLCVKANIPYMLLLKIINNFVPMDCPAAKNMQTTDPEIRKLNADGIAKSVKYWNIVGIDATEASVGSIKLINVRTVAKLDNGVYMLTKFGDGVVAEIQSRLPGTNLIRLRGVKHTALPGDCSVIKNVINILKNS